MSPETRFSPRPEPEVGALRDLCRRLEDFAALAEEVVAAVDREDVHGLMELAIRARQARAGLGRARQAASGPLPAAGTESVTLMARMKEAVARARLGETLLQQWSRRDLPTAEELLRSGEGTFVLAEAMLPPAWDFQRDVVLLAGPGLERLAETLLEIGQERLIVYLPADDGDEGGSDGAAARDYPRGAIVARRPEQIYQAVRSFAPHIPLRLGSKRLQGSSLSEKEYSDAVDQAQGAIRDMRVYRNTVNHFRDTWLTQGLANLPHLARWPSVHSIADSFAGRPMVIIAPGPSLKKNLHQLAQFHGKALLVAFSHTLTALKEAGVIPDLVVTVDAAELQYHFDGFPIRQVGAMISGVTVHPDLFAMPAPRHVTMGANSTLDVWLFECLGEDASVAAGGSVATTAFGLGLRMGCDPIICVGLDLSFPGGKYYVDTSCDGGIQVTSDERGQLRVSGFGAKMRELRDKAGCREIDEEPLVELPGYCGGTVPTSFVFRLFHSWFERTAKSVRDRVTLLNCTEGGAYIEGMEHVPLADAHARYVEAAEPLDVAAILDGIVAATDVTERRRVILGHTEMMAQRIREILELAHSCRELADSALEDPEVMSKYEKQEARLQDALSPLSFISMLSQPEIDRAMERARYATTLEDCMEASRDLFQTVIDAGEKVLPAVDKALAALDQPPRPPAAATTPR